MEEQAAVPAEALERAMSVLVWGWMNSERPEASLEAVARNALGAILGYIDEHCPEWYGRRWLRREEMAALTQALGRELDDSLSPPAARPDMESVTVLDGMSAQDKLTRALAEG
jgi:hypothetical protein